jgi:hypothetical protein
LLQIFAPEFVQWLDPALLEELSLAICGPEREFAHGDRGWFFFYVSFQQSRKFVRCPCLPLFELHAPLLTNPLHFFYALSDVRKNILGSPPAEFDILKENKQ